MTKYLGTGVPFSTGIDVSAQKPLDSRTVASNIAERDAIPDVQKYVGLTVFVEDNLTEYRWIGDRWIESNVTKESIMNDLPAVAKSGSYNDLVDKPSVKIVMGKDEPENIDEVGLWLNVIDDDSNQ